MPCEFLWLNFFGRPSNIFLAELIKKDFFGCPLNFLSRVQTNYFFRFTSTPSPKAKKNATWCWHWMSRSFLPESAVDGIKLLPSMSACVSVSQLSPGWTIWSAATMLRCDVRNSEQILIHECTCTILIINFSDFFTHGQWTLPMNRPEAIWSKQHTVSRFSHQKIHVLRCGKWC